MKNTYYQLDIGSDLYARPGTFTLWHVKAVLASIATLQQRYNLRECHFIYRKPNGEQLLQGELRNPVHPPPPCDVPADPQTTMLFRGTVRVGNFGEAISFEAVGAALLDIMLDVWARMKQARKSARELYVPNDVYTHETPFLRFQMRTKIANTFRLGHLLNMAYAVAFLGRMYPMRAFAFAMISVEGITFFGRVDKRDRLSRGNVTVIS